MQMRPTLFFLITCLLLSLAGCDSTQTEKSKEEEKSKDSLVETTPKEEVNTVADLRNECVRGQASAIVKKEVFKKSTFAVQADSLTGIEIVELPNGDLLTIKNWGCEYYVLTFRFETSRFQNDTSDLPFWFDKAQDFLIDIKNGIQAPIDLAGGIQALNSRCESSFHMNYESFSIGDEVDYGDGDMRSFVVVDRIQKLSEKKYAIEISFAVGPL